MNIDPLGTALEAVAAAELDLREAVVSSEQFDYPKAKSALRRLQRSIRQLGRLRLDFEAQLRARVPNIRVIDFQRGSSKEPAPGSSPGRK